MVPVFSTEHVRVRTADGEDRRHDMCRGNGYVMTSINGPSGREPGREGAGQSGKAQFLTVAEVAALMRVSKMTVYRLVHNGELPAVRVGRSFRVHAKAVNDLLQASYFDAG